MISTRNHMLKTLLLAASSAAVAIAVVAAPGCGGEAARPTCDANENAALRLIATDRANPDEEGRPLPTIIRIYQLKNIGVMETASFDDIWQRDEDTLGESFLGKDEVTIYPSTKIGREFERNPDANFIVGVAIVRRPTGVSWRTILELPPPAAEAQCAALQENPEEAPAEPPTVRLSFELDDYQIEGSVALEYPPPPCDPLDVICLAERAANDTVEDAEAPETPESPEAPSTDMPSTDMPSTSVPSI